MVSESTDDSTQNPSAPALVTRRQLREAEALARSPRAVRRSSAAGPVPAFSDRSSRRRAAPVAATSSKRSSHRVWQTAVTVLVVPGLFATAALPAYAASTDENGETVAAAAPILGQSFSVGATTVAAVDRGGVVPTSDAEMALRRADPGRQARVEAYDASGARQLGDDYPWPYEKADVEGGGLSPLNYYYRECVDFVAWRLNRDAGSTSAPWKYTWQDLTPNGGNASMWASNWRAHGWATGKDPVPGSVAWFAGNHVAYVKAVTADGDVVIEEYNHGSTHKYGIRTIPASQVALFLYAPPR